MTLADIYMHNWKRLALDEIRGPLSAIHEATGDERVTALRVSWPIGDVRRVLESEPLERFAGRTVFALTAEDLQRLSLKRLEIWVRCAIVKNLERCGPNVDSIVASRVGRPEVRGVLNGRATARFIGVGEELVRRTRARPEYRLYTVPGTPS